MWRLSRGSGDAPRERSLPDGGSQQTWVGCNGEAWAPVRSAAGRRPRKAGRNRHPAMSNSNSKRTSWPGHGNSKLGLR